MQQILQPIEQHHRRLWGSHTVKLQHNLAGSDMFSDESLAHLLDVVDPKYLGMKTMGDHCPDAEAWYRTSRDGVPGAAVLEAAKHGRIWINISAVHEAEPRFATLLDQLYDELQSQVPGFKTSKRRLGLLISSPLAHVVYHADPLGQGLVQVRGRKRVWIYPATSPFLQPQHIEDIVRGVTEEDLPYEPWFDQYAQAQDLEPGEMLYWALNSPHRVTNYDSLNVSLTTEHWTKDVRNNYLMNYGNGLRRGRGAVPRSRATSGPSFWFKAGLTAAERLRHRDSAAAPAGVATFRVDPAAPHGVRPITDGT